MEGIKGRSSEGPIDQCSQLKNEWNRQIATIDDTSDWIECVHEETSFANLRQTDAHLIRLNKEVKAEEEVEEDDVAIALKRVANVTWLSVLNDGVGLLIELWLALTPSYGRWQHEKAENVGEAEYGPEPVKLDDLGAGSLLFLWHKVLIKEEQVFLIIIV